MLRLLLDESQVAGPVLVRDADLALAHENKGKAFRMDFCVAPGKLQKRGQFLLQRVTAAVCDVWPSSTRQASAALRIAACLRVQDGPQANSAWMIHAQFGLGKALLCLTVVEDCPDLSVNRRPGRGNPLPQSSRGELCRDRTRSEEHTSELQSHSDLVCRLLLEKKKRT